MAKNTILFVNPPTSVLQVYQIFAQDVLQKFQWALKEGQQKKALDLSIQVITMNFHEK